MNEYKPDHDWPIEHYMTSAERRIYDALWWLHNVTHERLSPLQRATEAIERRAFARVG